MEKSLSVFIVTENIPIIKKDSKVEINDFPQVQIKQTIQLQHP